MRVLMIELLKAPLLFCLISVIGLVAVVSGQAYAQNKSCRVGTKIVGGERAKIKHWPGQASLRLRSQEAGRSIHFCGGTAISDRWILTAAHCLHDFTKGLTSTINDVNGIARPAKLEVVLGVDDLQSLSTTNIHAVDKIVIHPTYRAELDKALAIEDAALSQRKANTIALLTGHDIALVRLAKKYVGSTAALALSKPNATGSGRKVRVAGFGKTVDQIGAPSLQRFVRSGSGEEFFAGSDKLLETAVETIGTGQCRKHHSNAKIGAGQICAGHAQGGQDSCSGDSGGPLVDFDDKGCPFQIGVVSWGDPVCGGSQTSKAAYGVYTRVAQFGDWVQKQTGVLFDARPQTTSRPVTALSQADVREGIAQLRTLLGPVDGVVDVFINDTNRIKLNKELVFLVSSAVSGRLALIDINAKGEVHLIFPNRYVPAGPAERIAANKTIKVPGDGYGFRAFRAVPPLGKSTMIALVVPENFKIDRFIAPPQTRSKGFEAVPEPTSYFMRLIRQIEQFLVATRDSGGDPLKDWAFGVIEYEIYQ